MPCSRRVGWTPNLTDMWRGTKTKRAPTPRCDRPNQDPDSLELNQNAKKHSSSSPLCFIFYAKVSMLDKRSEKLEMFLYFVVWGDKFTFHFVVRFLIFWPFIVGMSRSFFLRTLFRFRFFFFLFSSLGDMYSSVLIFLCKTLNWKHQKKKKN